MKKFFLAVNFTLFTLSLVFAQDSYKKEVAWMGLDFTEAKLLTSVDFTDPAAIKNNLLVSWNDIIIKESPKEINTIKTQKIDLACTDNHRVLCNIRHERKEF